MSSSAIARCPRCARALHKIRSRSAPLPMTDGSHVVRAVCIHDGCGAELVVRQPPCDLGPPEVTLLAQFVTRLDERGHNWRRLTGALVALGVFAVPTVSAARCLSSITAYEAPLAWLPVPFVTLLSGFALGLLALAALIDAARDRRLLLGLVGGASLSASAAPAPPAPADAGHPYRSTAPAIGSARRRGEGA